MKHLDIDHIISALDGTATGQDRAHLEECTRCQQDLESWRQRLRELREMESVSLNESEIHNLRAMFRHYGPAPERQSWIARLVRRSEPTPVAVTARGGLSTTFEEYQAGPWGLVIQVKPSSGADLYDIHGQLTGAEVREGELLLTSDLGFGERRPLDSYGEFHLPGVPAGAYDATCLIGDVRIELKNLDVGDTDDRPGS
jgi:hypothetical protein